MVYIILFSLKKGCVYKIVIDLNEICSIDHLNPIERYCHLKPIDSSLESVFCIAGSDPGEVILIALFTIDHVLKQEQGVKYNFYILEDDSVQYLIQSALGISFLADFFKMSIVCVDEAKLIYRFTAAKKFRIMDDQIKQLRLNSWGREYIKEANLLIKYNAVFSQLRLFFIAYYQKNKEVYIRSMDLLLQEISEPITGEIRELNKKVKIKLLS